MSLKLIYTENGCQFSDDCRSCPLPDCGATRGYMRLLRDKSIKELYYKGKDKDELTVIFGVSMRTVERALSKY